MSAIAAQNAVLEPETRAGGDYAALSKQIRSAGLLERRYGYYAAKVTGNVLALGGAWVAFVFLGDSWWQLFIGAFLAIAYAQLALVGHDAGHKQIFRKIGPNNLVGTSHGLLVGMSYPWWVTTHNKHHANPNHESDDPDLDLPVLAFTKDQALVKLGISRWITKHQALMFFPLLMLEGWNLHITGIRAMLRKDVKARRKEALLMATHVVLYFGAVFTVLSPGIAVLFILVHQSIWGIYMGSIFAPNHKGMPTLTDEDNADWIRKQVLTSRNVRGGVVVDFVLGGLNYQIEHHLFPNMPRPNLRRAQPIVEKFCNDHGISYMQCGLFRSYRYVLGHLHEMSEPLRIKAVEA